MSYLNGLRESEYFSIPINRRISIAISDSELPEIQTHAIRWIFATAFRRREKTGAESRLLHGLSADCT